MRTQRNRLTLLKIEDVFAYFDRPVSTFLTIEQAVCYIASTLLKTDCYGTGLIENLNQAPDNYALSDTICHAALAFTVKEGLATSTEKKASRRGRPRRMFKLKPSQREKVKELAAFWDGMIAGGRTLNGLHPDYPLRLFFTLEPDEDDTSFFCQRPAQTYVVYDQVVSDLSAAKYQVAVIAENAGKTAPPVVYIERDFAQTRFFAL